MNDPKTPSVTNAHEQPPAQSVGSGSSGSTRETREWWVAHNGSALRVTGYTCAPKNPEMWWCPEIGHSCSEGHHLFATEGEAIEKIIAELERLLEEGQERLTALRLRRSNTPGSREAR